MAKPYKYNKDEAVEKRKEEVDGLMKKLEQGVMDVFRSDNYKNYLETMARFPKYSVNNTILIMIQTGGKATYVAPYKAWPKMNRHVRAGEKGIRILAPVPYKKKVDLKAKGGTPIKDMDGKTEQEEVDAIWFKPVSTFDVSQTEGEPLPTLGVDELMGSVEGYEKLKDALIAVSPVPVAFEDIQDGSKGYFNFSEGRIAVKQGMSNVQTLKTLAHEITHAKLHGLDHGDNVIDKSREQKEVEAESTAFVVMNHYGIPTDDYSFGYVAGWSSGKDVKELKASLTTIRKAATDIIKAVDEKLMPKEKEAEDADEIEGIEKKSAADIISIVDKVKKNENAPAVKPVDRGMEARHDTR